MVLPLQSKCGRSTHCHCPTFPCRRATVQFRSHASLVISTRFRFSAMPTCAHATRFMATPSLFDTMRFPCHEMQFICESFLFMALQRHRTGQQCSCRSSVCLAFAKLRSAVAWLNFAMAVHHNSNAVHSFLCHSFAAPSLPAAALCSSNAIPCFSFAWHCKACRCHAEAVPCDSLPCRSSAERFCAGPLQVAAKLFRRYSVHIQLVELLCHAEAYRGCSNAVRSSSSARPCYAPATRCSSLSLLRIAVPLRRTPSSADASRIEAAPMLCTPSPRPVSAMRSLASARQWSALPILFSATPSRGSSFHGESDPSQVQAMPSHSYESVTIIPPHNYGCQVRIDTNS